MNPRKKSRGDWNLMHENCAFEAGAEMTEFDDLKLVLSANLKRFRAEIGISQERLALESGVDRTVVSRLERCLINPSLLILVKLANRLKVSPDLLIRKPGSD